MKYDFKSIPMNVQGPRIYLSSAVEAARKLNLWYEYEEEDEMWISNDRDYAVLILIDGDGFWKIFSRYFEDGEPVLALEHEDEWTMSEGAGLISFIQILDDVLYEMK